MTRPVNPFDLTGLAPGDVIAVNTHTPGITELIQTGGILTGETGMDDHIVIVHHFTDGVPWGIEGRPGGVGWADLRRYMNEPHSVGNVSQPKSDAQRAMVVKASETLIGTPYDWAAIATDTLAALHLPDLFAENWHGNGAPGHVVCSSLAAYLYGQAALSHPVVHSERRTTPPDWTEFNLAHMW